MAAGRGGGSGNDSTVPEFAYKNVGKQNCVFSPENYFFSLSVLNINNITHLFQLTHSLMMSLHPSLSFLSPVPATIGIDTRTHSHTRRDASESDSTRVHLDFPSRVKSGKLCPIKALDKLEETPPTSK